MAIIGYGRVSTIDQSLDLQEEKLKEYGCEKIFMEKQSGAKSDRDELIKALDYLREGDKLVVYKIDRLARSTFDLQKIAKDLEERGIALVFIKEQIDFSTPSGKLMFTMLGAIAEFERDLIKDRTTEGRERAKAQGKHMGRKGKDEKDVKKALKLYDERGSNGLSVNDIAKMTGVPRSTIYAKVKEMTSEGSYQQNAENVRKEKYCER
ncbi:recombinase family protein [Campylobacter jejuni]|nr:recombinase family protein [Campylobacter jejuni]